MHCARQLQERSTTPPARNSESKPLPDTLPVRACTGGRGHGDAPGAHAVSAPASRTRVRPPPRAPVLGPRLAHATTTPRAPNGGRGGTLSGSKPAAHLVTRRRTLPPTLAGIGVSVSQTITNRQQSALKRTELASAGLGARAPTPPSLLHCPSRQAKTQCHAHVCISKALARLCSLLLAAGGGETRPPRLREGHPPGATRPQCRASSPPATPRPWLLS